MRIYVSSTFGDLEQFRAAVVQAFRQSGHDVVAMEDYVAASRRPLEQVRGDVAQCDACVSMVAWRYGYVPPPSHGDGSGQSITELEYRTALATGKPVLAFLTDPAAAWPPTSMDSHTGENEAGARVRAFREELKTEHLVGFFATPEQLVGQALPAVYRLEGQLGRRAQVAAVPAPPDEATPMELTEVLDEIRSHLADTRHAFVAQTTQRDALRRDMEQRLHPTDDPPLEHERFFAKYYDQLTEGERFQFARIRALTDGPMETGNRRILQLLNDIPEARQAIPDLDRLRQHLAFWINKYDHLFLHNPNMCVLYVGVEDRTPFPTGVEDKIVSSQE